MNRFPYPIRMVVYLLLICCILLTANRAAHAAPGAIRTVGIGCTYSSLQQAVDAAASGDDIRVRGGIGYNEKVVISNKNLTISGGWSQNCTVAVPNQHAVFNGIDTTGSVFKISGNNTVLLVDLIIFNGSDDADDGGGIEIDNATVTLANVRVYGNESDNGGGVHMDGGHLLLTNGSFIQSNTATQNGGGIYATGGGTITLQTGTRVGSEISGQGNSAYNGGGIYVANANQTTRLVTLNGTALVVNNHATGLVGLGGGIYMQGGTLNVTGAAALRGNSAYTGGGIVGNNGAQMVVSGLIEDNSALFRGGGISVSGATSALQLNGATITGNTAAEGGGVATNAAQVVMVDGALGGLATADGNTATDNGGGLFCVAALCLLNGTLVSENSAPNGGGIFQSGGTLQVQGAARVRANRATGNGAGIHGDQNAFLAIFGTTEIGGPTTADGNVLSGVEQGGGIYNNGASANLQLMESVLVAHNSAYRGAGIGVEDGTVGIGGNVRIRDNSAGETGGGLFSLGSDIDMFHSAAISANSAVVGGGGVFISFGTLDLTQLALIGGDSAADGNHAAQFGGGVYVNATPVTVAGDARVRFNSVDQHGGGVALQGSSSFSGNGGQVADNSAGGNGGGIWTNSANEAIALSNTDLLRNSATNNGGGIYSGGPISISSRPDGDNGCNAMLLPAHTYCAELRANSAGGSGAAIYAHTAATLALDGVAVLDHTTGQAAIYLDGSALATSLTDSLFADNGVVGYRSEGGGAHTWSQLTFAGHSGRPFVLAGTGGTLNVSNTIAWANGIAGAVGNYSLSGGCNRSTGGVLPGSDNSNPRFVTTDRGPYRLRGYSPAVDACATGSARDLERTVRPVLLVGPDGYDQGAFELVALPTAVTLAGARAGAPAGVSAIAIAIVIVIVIVIAIENRWRWR